MNNPGYNVTTSHMMTSQNVHNPVTMKKSLLSVLRNTAKDEPDTVKARKVKLRKAAEGFEAIFIRHILRIMRSSIQDGGMFGKGAAGEIYGDMMDNILAENMSKRSALGLADMLYRQMVKEIEQSGDEVSPHR